MAPMAYHIRCAACKQKTVWIVACTRTLSMFVLIRNTNFDINHATVCHQKKRKPNAMSWLCNFKFCTINTRVYAFTICIIIKLNICNISDIPQLQFITNSSISQIITAIDISHCCYLENYLHNYMRLYKNQSEAFFDNNSHFVTEMYGFIE